MALVDYYNTYTIGTGDAQSKFSYHILLHLSDLYNFTLDAQETTMWIPGDTLGPIARALINYTADLTGTPISINAKRLKIIKFMYEDWPFRTCFIFRNPQPTNIKVAEVFRPLENQFPEWEVQQFYKNYWPTLPKSKWFIPPKDRIKLVKDGGFAYHTHPKVGYPHIEQTFENHEICELTEVDLAQKIFTAFAVTWNSSIVEIGRVG
ncbi:hypothetical protein TKK_0015813 [Trichogramma kaykai]